MHLQSYLDHPSHGSQRASNLAARSNGLTPNQLTRLARSLHDDLELLHRQLADDQTDPGLVIGAGPVAELDRHEGRRTAEQARRSIEETNRAIAALDAGTYEFCADCSRPILFERLEARPATLGCEACAGPRGRPQEP